MPPETVEASCYAFLPDDGSDIRRRIGRVCAMHEAASWSHAEVAARLNEARVQVLVDLTGLTLGPRMHLLAAHPCPVQVHWHGYPGTLGASGGKKSQLIFFIFFISNAAWALTSQNFCL